MVYHGSKKKKGRSPGKYTYSKLDMKRVNWCMKKGISIAIIPSEESGDWKLELVINNNKHIDPKEYKGEDALKKMYEYYKYYYDKNTD